MTRILSIVFLIAGLIAISPNYVHAQESGLKIGIARPADGETLYCSPTSPFVSTQVAGWVTGDGSVVTQLQVRLEILQGTQLFSGATTTPRVDGTFSFDVAINPNLPASKSSGEYGCKGDCHAITSLGFPPGAVLVRVSVTDALGRKATAQRSIIVDHSGYADVPVRVVAASDSHKTLSGLNIIADTRLYEWRAREYSAKTDAQGATLLHLEALAQAPTRYIFDIEPIVLDGVLYQSREPLHVILSPGAKTIEPITLIAETLRGKIDGIVMVNGRVSPIPLTVRAIELPRGAAHIVKATEGKFSLAELPISKYLIAVDDEDAAAYSLQASSRLLDLSQNPITSTTLVLSPAPARTVRGAVHDSDGNSLPFAWISAGGQGRAVRVSPSSGEFTLHGLPDGARSLRVTVPGYWSRPIALGADRLDITLARQPDTRVFPWGTGTITLPPQTIANLSGNYVALKRGWVWGKGSGSFIISTPELEITLQKSTFALEYLPGATAWLYVREGEAQVTLSDNDETITLGARQMLAFGKDVKRPSAVALDDTVVRALHFDEASPVLFETEPSVPARLRDELENLGISSQAATFGVFVAAIIVVMGARLLRRRRREQTLEEKHEP